MGRILPSAFLIFSLFQSSSAWSLGLPVYEAVDAHFMSVVGRVCRLLMWPSGTQRRLSSVSRLPLLSSLSLWLCLISFLTFSKCISFFVSPFLCLSLYIRLSLYLHLSVSVSVSIYCSLSFSVSFIFCLLFVCVFCLSVSSSLFISKYIELSHYPINTSTWNIERDGGHCVSLPHRKLAIWASTSWWYHEL